MYAVGINGKWTTDGRATIEFFESKGCVVQEARLHGDYDVFFEHKRICSLFKKKSDQIKHLLNKGLIGPKLGS